MKIRQYMGIDRDRISWQPYIDAEKCTGCGTCEDFCPNDVFGMAGDVMSVANPLNCVPACDRCAGECPVSAITFPSKEDLLKQIDALRRSQAR